MTKNEPNQSGLTHFFVFECIIFDCDTIYIIWHPLF